MRDQKSLPRGWARATMQDVAAIVGGGTPSTRNPAFWEGGDIPWITPADLSTYEHKTISCGARSITPLGLERSGAVLLPAGTVLYSSRAPIGYVAIASNSLSTNQGFKSFVLEPGITSDYIYYYLQFAKPLILSLASGTTFRELSGRRARVIPVVLAPTNEQSRIVEAIESYVSRIDDALGSLERVQAKLKAYRASVLKAAVEGRLVPTEASLAHAEKREYEPAEELLARILKERRRRWEEAELARLKAAGKVPNGDKWKARYKEPAGPDTKELPALPEGWCWANIGQIGLVSGGLTQHAKRQRYRTKLPFLRVANVYANALMLNEVKTIGVKEAEVEQARVLAGDLLVVEGNGSIDQIGRVALWDGSVDPILHQNHLIKVRFALSQVSHWVLAWLLSPAGRTLIRTVASSTSGLHTLSISKVASLPVPLPPLAEQALVSGDLDIRLSLADNVTEGLRTDYHRCLRLRQAVLKWAFEGNLADQDPSDEPAEKLLSRIKKERSKAQFPTRTPGRKVRHRA